MARKDAPLTAEDQQEQVTEGIEKFELPRSLVTKIAKSAIPETAKLQKDTVLSLVKSSTVFINYLAATAHDVALSKQHKSISASDVFKALETIEFGDRALLDLLQTELTAYRELAKTDKGKKGSASTGPSKSKASGAGASASAPAPAHESVSISIPRPKGKGKAAPADAAASVSAARVALPSHDVADAMVVDAPDTAEDEEVEAGDEDEEIAEEEEEEDVVEEDEELVDTVALEEEELQRDTRGLDAIPVVNEDIDI